MIKSGLTNDDLIRFYETVFAPTNALLNNRPHPPESVNGEDINDWYDNNEESKSWNLEYDRASEKGLAAYLGLRQRIGRRIGAYLIAGPQMSGLRETGKMHMHVFPRSLFPSRASVKQYFLTPSMKQSHIHREEFPAGIAYIYRPRSRVMIRTSIPAHQ